MPQPSARTRFFEILLASISDGSLEKLTLGKYRGADATLQNVFARPVLLKGGAQLSFVYRHDTRDITKNLAPDAAVSLLEKLIAPDFLDAHLFSASQNAQLSCELDGSARLRVKAVEKSGCDAAASPAVLAPHNRQRQYAIPMSAPWLQALGITNERGQLRADMSAKFRQINKFTELLSHLAMEAKLISEPQLIPVSLGGGEQQDAAPALRVADMGCGKGYLTFAAAAFLGARALVQGVETRAELVTLCNRIAKEQGFSNLSFTRGSIADIPFAQGALDILVALHACDTATDDAIAKGVGAGARLIVVSPCCQKELRPQLVAPPVLAGALRHGIFQERQAEFVTDALRAQLLECAGYRTKVFEFVSTEHTAKNLMIAAIKTHAAGDAVALEKVREFARFYGIHHQTLASHLKINLAP